MGLGQAGICQLASVNWSDDPTQSWSHFVVTTHLSVSPLSWQHQGLGRRKEIPPFMLIKKNYYLI